MKFLFLPMEKHEIPPSPREECPVLCWALHQLLSGCGAEATRLVHTLLELRLLQFAGGRCTLRSSSGVLLMIGSRESPAGNSSCFPARNLCLGLGRSWRKLVLFQFSTGRALHRGKSPVSELQPLWMPFAITLLLPAWKRQRCRGSEPACIHPDLPLRGGCALPPAPGPLFPSPGPPTMLGV